MTAIYDGKEAGERWWAGVRQKKKRPAPSLEWMSLINYKNSMPFYCANHPDLY